MRTFDDFKSALTELNRDYPRPGLQPLHVSDVYDLDAETVLPYPGAGLPGVYILMNANQEVAYVGKASFSHVVGKRLGDYFMYGPGRKGTVCKVEAWKDKGLRYLAVVSLPVKHSFEAGAIEEFLISRLQPPLNKIGIRGGVDLICEETTNPS